MQGVHIGKNNSRYKYLVNWVVLEASDKEKDVGVIIQEDLKPKKQCASAAAKSNSILGLCTPPPWILYSRPESLAD